MIYTVNRQTLFKNRKYGTNDPPIRVAKTKRGAAVDYVHEAEIAPGVWIRHRPDSPTKCGAVVYVETK